MSARLRERYNQSILGEMKSEFNIDSPMDVPRLDKIVINMGVGDSVKEPRLLDAALSELASITGQKPSVRNARKSISNFKIRAGMKVGCMVTLRGDRMYEFIDRLFNVAMPRIRDFRGVSPKSFDRFGNYTIGLKEQTIFPELNLDAVSRVRGMNITFVIRNSVDADQSRTLLRKLGMPFSG